MACANEQLGSSEGIRAEKYRPRLGKHEMKPALFMRGAFL